MNKATLLSLMMFSVNCAVAQSKDEGPALYGTYGGGMDNKLWNELFEGEKEAYLQCVMCLGLDTATIKWISDSTFSFVNEDKDYFSTKVIVIHSDDTMTKSFEPRIYPGKNTLETPECLLFIWRKGFDTEVRVQMYY